MVCHVLLVWRGNPGLDRFDTIEGWGVHPIIVVTARDWARMSAGDNTSGNCGCGGTETALGPMTARWITIGEATVHFPDSFAMARMGPIEVHVHRSEYRMRLVGGIQVSNLADKSVERAGRLCACANEKETTGEQGAKVG
ncbi:uncharacterized protein PgNI_01152 [Pyricularia grisea]|uniref:Uncharacterized protein n=1 Tax=Pyricularia grisea TaxID=148305 RepID=A0A6P8BIN5_PYRGI